jgi:hypothetical protein
MNDWVALAKKWGYNYNLTKYMNEMFAAFKAINEVNAIIVDSKLSDLGGQISLSCLFKSTPKTLDEHLLIMSDFTDSIHYEIAEYIDVPFTQAVGNAMSNAYTLNPKDFKTSGGVFGFGSKSLESLITDIIDDDNLKKNLKEQFKDLNEDEIPENLKEIIDDANYWAKEFEKAGKIRDLQKAFLDECGTKWDSMTEDKRKKALRRYARKVGIVLGDGKDIVGGAFFYSDNFDTSYGSHIPILYGDLIGLNNNNIDGNPNRSLKDILNTVVHECRHRQQSVESNNLLRSNNSRENEWRSGFLEYLYNENMDYYWTNSIEEDARAFAALGSA